MLHVGSIVTYKNDWKEGRLWQIMSLYSGNLCSIAVLRNGSPYHEKNGWKQINANIVNLNIDELSEIHQ